MNRNANTGDPIETVATLANNLAAGRTSSRALVEQALVRIADPAGEGSRSFVKVYDALARAEADYADHLRRADIRRSPVDGLPISLKDLFDVGGDVTRAGSKVLADAPPAPADAPVVARLRAAGAIVLGRTNMVEFAFGTTGLNPHYGTPRNPWDRQTGRIPGGSSSGAAVAVADGMSVMGLGSDTRGSVRAPAALCGVAGFKPTSRRIPREGVFPLSYTLDSVGPLAPTIACCAAYDAVMSGTPDTELPDISVQGMRLMVPRTRVLDGLDPAVEHAFGAAVSALSSAGAVVSEVRMAAFDRQDVYFKGGGYSGAEAAMIHRPWAHRLAEYDRRVGQRIALGTSLSALDYIEFGQLRAAFIKEVEAAVMPFDAMLLPAVPCVAPPIAEVDASDESYTYWTMRILSICGLINFLDGCAATVPCHAPGTVPVGLMVCGPAMTDRYVLMVASAIESVLLRRYERL
jgi:aspartyl-tRNA(Asn)/glutamyl-tRNA(Gln) amidotransferase subunit A